MIDEEALGLRLAALEERLTLLEDEKSIREVLARYGYYADACLDDQYIELFTRDCVMDISSGDPDDPFKVIEWRGRDAIRDFLTERTDRHGDGFRGRSLHVQGNNLAIRISGAEATATGYSFILRQGDADVCLVSASINRWQLRKDDGRWRVQRRVRRGVGAPDTAAVLKSDGD